MSRGRGSAEEPFGQNVSRISEFRFQNRHAQKLGTPRCWWPHSGWREKVSKVNDRENTTIWEVAISSQPVLQRAGLGWAAPRMHIEIGEWKVYLRFEHFCGMGRERNLPGLLLGGRTSFICWALANAASSITASGTKIIWKANRFLGYLEKIVSKSSSSLFFVGSWNCLSNFSVFEDFCSWAVSIFRHTSGFHVRILEQF